MRCLGSDERRDVDECVLEARVLSLGVDQEAMDLFLGPWLGAYVQFDIPHPLEGAAAPRRLRSKPSLLVRSVESSYTLWPTYTAPVHPAAPFTPRHHDFEHREPCPRRSWNSWVMGSDSGRLLSQNSRQGHCTSRPFAPWRVAYLSAHPRAAPEHSPPGAPPVLHTSDRCFPRSL